jgi:hypothetical protein
MEDLFDEIGMEYMDESSLPEDDDERRESHSRSLSLYLASLSRWADKIAISIEERIRQTLMTHMWPNMIRKPVQSRMDLAFEDDDEDYDQDINVDEDDEEGKKAGFPITFNPQSRALPSDPANEDDFPGLDELKSQIMLEDLDRLREEGEGSLIDQSGFSRRGLMDVFNDLGGEGRDHWFDAEYAKLDDWLDDDNDDDDDGNQPPNQSQSGYQDQLEGYDEELDMAEIRKLQKELEAETDEIEESQFEDDFADFAPFQSAPPPATSATDGLDPTPLLLHLQNVREELAGLDEDTRRERAGREVESVLKSLGLGGLDWEDDLDDGM